MDNKQVYTKTLETLGATIGNQSIAIARLQAENDQLKTENAQFKQIVADLGANKNAKKVNKNERTTADTANKQEHK